MILFGFNLLLLGAAATASISGWLIDNECWKQPKHIGFDGANLETAPQDHSVHCLLLKICKDSGFFLRDRLANGTFVNVGSFDAGGNAKVITLLETLPDSQRNVYVTVETEINGSGETATFTNIVSIKTDSPPTTAAATTAPAGGSPNAPAASASTTATTTSAATVLVVSPLLVLGLF